MSTKNPCSSTTQCFPHVLFIILTVSCGTPLVGCAPVEMPNFDLSPIDYGQRQAPDVKHITVKNGAGEVLLDQDVRAGDGVSANPPLSKLDGTLVIEETLTDGNTRTQTVKSKPGERIRFAWEAPLGKYVVAPATEMRQTAGATVSTGQHEVPEVGVGTVITPGSETFLKTSRFRVDGLGLGVNWSGRYGRFDLRGFAGDETSNATEPVGGRPVAITYHGLAANGSTGLGLGATGLDARVEVDAKEYEYSWKLSHVPLYRGRIGDDGMTSIAPRVVIGRRDTQYVGRLQSLTFPDIFSTTRQDVEEWYAGGGIAGHWICEHSERSKYILGANLDLLYRDAEYDGRQRNVCGGCPSAEQDFTVTTRDDGSGVTWRAKVSAGGSHRFGKNIGIGADVSYFYLDETAALKNPANPSDPRPHLKDESVDGWTIGARFTYGF